ncbi:uncharacterized protein LOC126706240 [Quercus robur]|uniref:uncharacterized protein LOC126706240 n=1 Tax=Quercus robur TaxID=38942 RepID=UPI0021626F35|nr:uncharacterized protein LOC126706240 [Quercus robur]
MAEQQAKKRKTKKKKKEAVCMTDRSPTTSNEPLMPHVNSIHVSIFPGSKDSQEYHWLGPVIVHVKDVAKAQVLLFETPALGLVGNVCHKETGQPGVLVLCEPRINGETQPGLTTCRGAAKRLIDLGLVFIPVEDAVQDTVESIKAKGFLNQKMPQS